ELARKKKKMMAKWLKICKKTPSNQKKENIMGTQGNLSGNHRTTTLSGVSISFDGWFKKNLIIVGIALLILAAFGVIVAFVLHASLPSWVVTAGYASLIASGLTLVLGALGLGLFCMLKRSKKETNAEVKQTQQLIQNTNHLTLNKQE